LRSAERIKEYIVTIVVQDKNYKELPDFIDKCLSEFNPDLIVTRVIKPWFNLSIENFNKKTSFPPNIQTMTIS